MEIRYLSDLENGQSAVISKVKGYGAFRKRITEMGFVYGTPVKAIKKAPLQDPVEYEVMDYRVSLRRSEAAMIEVVDNEDAALSGNYGGTLPAEGERQTPRRPGRNIQVALVGNPNSGKTTIFNRATGKHERVGNYGGVTVDLKTAHFHQGEHRIDLTDLPGTYSISEYSPEELFVRKHLTENWPDVVVNVVDASNLERNLFLTTQLIDMNIRVVIALNMHDELTARGDRFDYDRLGAMLGIPVVPTVASKGRGIGTLLDKVIEVYEETAPSRHIHINYGTEINTSIERVRAEIKRHDAIGDAFHAQYAAIKLLEGDAAFTAQIAAYAGSESIVAAARAEIVRLEKAFGAKTETIIADA
jgi:ferrous iron transport protein B